MFWETRFSKEILQDYKEALGSYGYAGQLMQTPTPLNSGMIKSDWLKIDTDKKYDENSVVNFIIDPIHCKSKKRPINYLRMFLLKTNGK